MQTQRLSDLKVAARPAEENVFPKTCMRKCPFILDQGVRKKMACVIWFYMAKSRLCYA